ncbi:hypothetical protein AAY473_004740 [Plecturocebus cupreus]
MVQLCKCEEWGSWPVRAHEEELCRMHLVDEELCRMDLVDEGVCPPTELVLVCQYRLVHEREACGLRGCSGRTQSGSEKTESRSVIQAGVQWRDLGSLQPPPRRVQAILMSQPFKHSPPAILDGADQLHPLAESSVCGLLSSSHICHLPDVVHPTEFCPVLGLPSFQRMRRQRISLKELGVPFKRQSLGTTKAMGELHGAAGTAESGSHYNTQAGLELVASSNPPALASQSTGVAGISHHIWPKLCLTLLISDPSHHEPWHTADAQQIPLGSN